MLLLLCSLACGEKDEDTALSEDTSAENDSADTASDTDTDTSVPEETGSETGGETVQSCEALEEDECVSREDCYPLSGHPMSFSEADQCWEVEASQFTHCMSVEMGCGDAITYAQNPDSGECWWFSSTCTPEGWTICDYPEEPECVQ